MDEFVNQMKSPPKDQSLRLSLSFFIAAIAGYQLRTFLLWDPIKIAQYGFLIDDAYFYAVLAKNFIHHHILTLDGTMPTTGVQPLWMCFQIILNSIFSKVDSVTLITVSSWLCYILFTFLLVWLLNRTPSIATLLATTFMSGLLLLQPAFQFMVMRGLETPLMLVILIFTLIIFDQIFNNENQTTTHVTIRQSSLLALLSALLFFARTDLFWAPIVIFIWLLIKGGGNVKNLAIFTAILFLLITPYLYFNYATGQNIMPISGRVKLFYLHTCCPDMQSYIHSTEWHGPFHLFDINLGLILLPIGRIVRYALILLLIAITLIIVWEKRHTKIFPSSLYLLSLIISFHLTYLQFFYRELRPYTAYYFLPELLFVTLTMAYSLKYMFINFKHHPQTTNTKKLLLYYIQRYLWIAPLAYSLSILIGSHLKVSYSPKEYWIQRFKLAEDISHLVPPDEKVAAFWPGLFAQYSGRPIIPLDGIIGSDEYFQQYVKTGNEIKFIRENGVKYLIVYCHKNIDSVLSTDKLTMNDWAMRGIQLVWENKNDIAGVLSRRLIQPNGEGWYLLEVNIH